LVKLHQYIGHFLNKRKGFFFDKNTYSFENGKNLFAQLSIEERRLILKTKGNFESETVFFEILRKSEPSFLAVAINEERYGWLKPIKERNFV
ncbi:sporulation inhibitor of replication protein SirA, partial [Bacillaceae bacterium Marseille-Q3522]|nr:sporulation inhibitor of replication protein SirA [Bacillaceae bacterium Marseille-Q3522]